MTSLVLNHYSQEEVSRLFNLSSPRDLFHQRTPALADGDVKQKVEEIRSYVHSTMELYERVFECLSSEEAFFVQPIHKLRHPLIFYYGHTACFYINKLCAAGLSMRIRPHLEEAFAVGVDEMSWDDLNEEHYNWPTVEEVVEYRRAVRKHVDGMMTSGKFELTLPLTFAGSTENADSSFWWLMLMCAEHERIHVETASVHVRELPMRYVRPSMDQFWKPCGEAGCEAPANELVDVAGGRVAVGRAPNSELYGWDCDYSDGNYVLNVAPFKASKYLVSNAEFFTFVVAGGYATQRYWDEEGWNWVQWRKPECPWFWVRDENRPKGYALRLQTTLIDLPWSWPCEINNLEARAFCNFKSEQTGKKIRMPTEAEWLILWDRYVGKDQMLWDVAPGNVNMEHFQSSCPVDKFAHGPFFDIVGNVWQHCETPVYPYPGYQVHPFYYDFSMPTFDGRHACMKGGAWVSTGNEATRDARFAFRRHFFQYIGLRYVEGEPVQEGFLNLNSLGLDPMVDAITDANYRPSFNDIPNGFVQIAEFVMNQFRCCARTGPKRALDFACGAGRIAFELTSMFDQVVGSDFSARLLIPAYAISERGSYTYSIVNSSTSRRVEQTFKSLGYPWDATRGRAVFFQADPTNLHSHMKDFSLILCWNTLDRSYNPTAVPSHMVDRLVVGGLIVFGLDGVTDEVNEGKREQGGEETPKQVVFSENEIYHLLGGENVVDRVGDPTQLTVAFPASDSTATFRKVRLSVYRKK
ncbi:hypothetical protein, conserved [Trypanosoma brucei gambiense DAL972]|uniref:Generic methyltransferase n=1 Tax=Trypanosoma brucei gambiense (strain MHOM/CI/86/DAL972) TaxID=679716 RepID=C9ZLK2_TRYB9|nr:hypothetical protein, conserved [Trypanosoma brucei gambiense DAL972]CBH10211.1 hypothetical protein, conserved [Trypanosoma brucei gambiense DAL972]|eukprot:XP_011772501.1 hypothetical protein, conserved [Trypanosoma brucei gambiense DAL972]